MSFEAGDEPRNVGGKGPDAFRTISEVADELGLPQHVLRFWETRFPQIKPIKRGGGRRYYRPGDVDLLRGIKQLLYGEGYTIRGVQRILREQGGRKLAQSAGSAAVETTLPDDGPSLYAPRRQEPVFELEAEEPEPVVRRPAAEDLEPESRGVDDARDDQPSADRPGLTEAQTRRLAAALDDLTECRRILDGWS
ncbi:MerR family transcriptional regulator [Chelatococcus sambhunathii]|uniref:MerR family transcriptional regulator n=1 Tax=Chelatococcus sambhunathii TaxID=363953 RepID=A0ABU1DDG8_9HYPH|nr:MerR family transcriptional regulator [Chelatococcus sambhunathii]MDR4306146.1 MerR family transcriptional regulator [Chelatococcus sambhunathii]